MREDTTQMPIWMSKIVEKCPKTTLKHLSTSLQISSNKVVSSKLASPPSQAMLWVSSLISQASSSLLLLNLNQTKCLHSPALPIPRLLRDRLQKNLTMLSNLSETSVLSKVPTPSMAISSNKKREKKPTWDFKNSTLWSSIKTMTRSQSDQYTLFVLH